MSVTRARVFGQAALEQPDAAIAVKNRHQQELLQRCLKPRRRPQLQR